MKDTEQAINFLHARQKDNQPFVFGEQILKFGAAENNVCRLLARHNSVWLNASVGIFELLQSPNLVSPL